MYNISSSMIKDNIQKVRQLIQETCRASGRDQAQVSIICVTKGRSIPEIEEAVSCGLTDIGENKLQETLLKYDLLKPPAQGPSPLRWHMIGHLQSNKVKEAVRIFDLIHSVDSLGLARQINGHAARIGKVQGLLLEVKTSPEESKYGFSPADIPAIKKELSALANISLRGLMTIAPLGAKGAQAREYFSVLRKLRDEVDPGWLLSMGMSEDFQAAVLEGADMVRLGRIIFEGQING